MKKVLIIFLIAGGSLFPGCQKDSSKLVTHNYTKQQWIGGLIGILSGMKLHINNYTPVKNQYEQEDIYAYENPKSSSLLIPSVSSVPLVFDVPVTREDPYSLYIDDLNSTRLMGDAHDGDAFITVNFESDGVEIKGDCINNAACVCGNPTMDLNNIVAIIPLTFAPAKDGSVNIASGDVSFTSDATETGPCVDNVCAFACSLAAPDRKVEMQTTVEKFIEDYVDQNSSLISPLFTQYLKTLGVTGPIVSIQIKSNGDLAVEDKE